MFLVELAELIEELGLVRSVPVGQSYYRVRNQTVPPFEPTAAALGPPPARICLQSNRMNPHGIPMFYGAEDGPSAIAEARADEPVLARFQTEMPIIWSTLPSFHGFRGSFECASAGSSGPVVSAPADSRDGGAGRAGQSCECRLHPDPDRHRVLQRLAILCREPHGIRYVSALGSAAANVVLFAGPENVVDADASEDGAWLRLVEVEFP